MTVIARRSSLLLVFALTCFALALIFSAQQASAATCTLSSNDKKPNRYGPTYLKFLSVSGGPSCAGGKDLVRAFYICRTKGSKPVTGKCTVRVSGYSCSETRYSNITTSYDAKVTCKKGSRKVIHRYQQFKD